MTTQPSPVLEADPGLEESDVRLMISADVDAAESIFRLAFGTEFALSDPFEFRRSARLVAGRFAMDPDGALVATQDGEVIGFSMASRWGSLGLLGPVCVHPRLWNRGVARLLVGRTVERIDAWGCRWSGLFTNPSSPRHLRLYQSFGYQPGHLVVILTRDRPQPSRERNYAGLSQRPDDLAAFVTEARVLAGRGMPGLDLGSEIARVVRHGWGNVLFARGEAGLDWFAICHFGQGSEAEQGELYVKFAIADEGRDGSARFERMVSSLLDYAAVMGLSSVSLGVSVGRPGLYRALLARGFQGRFHGLLMQRPPSRPHERADALILEDWR